MLSAILFGMLAWILPAPVQAQSPIYTWNNIGADWNTATNWSASNGDPGVPAGADVALFQPFQTPAGTVAVQPVLNNNLNVSGVIFGPNQNLGGWTLGGTGTLNVGNVGLRTYGPQMTTIDGPSLQSLTLGSARFHVGAGSTVSLAGTSTTAGTFGIDFANIRGGTLRLDNSTTALSRVTSNFRSFLSGGGTLELVGNANTPLTQNVGSFITTATGGVNTYRVTPQGLLTELVFANNSTNYSISTNNFSSIIHFAATSGNLGDSNGARIRFAAGAPYLGRGELLGPTLNSDTVGYAIASDAGGTHFATWNATQGIVRASTNVTVTDAAGLASLMRADSRGQFNAPAGQTVTATENIDTASLRITPTGPGSILALQQYSLQTSALMLDGPHDFAITGSGEIGNGTSRFIYVNNPDATLSLSQWIASSNHTTVFAGPGFVELTGNGSQNTSTNGRINIAGGVLRASANQLGFGSTGSGFLLLTGGVLEIKNGNNGTGSAADFTRSLGIASSGAVAWGGGQTVAVESGSGGFSAYGSAASVNLGGQSTPEAVRWHLDTFVQDGHALVFGSRQANAPLHFLNPIELDSPSATQYALREIRVHAGTGGDRAVLHGVISGPATAGFLKTGDGVLEFLASNTYAGNTIISRGTLQASNTTGSATGTGQVTIDQGGTLAGGGTVGSGASTVTALAGGTIAPGPVGSTGTLTVNGSVAMFDDSIFSWDIYNTSPAAAAWNSGLSNASDAQDELAVVGAANTLAAGDISFRVRELIAPLGLTPGDSYSWRVATSEGSASLGAVTFDLSDAPTYAAFASQHDYYFSLNAVGGNVYLNFQPVPEPAGLVLVLSMVGLGWARFRRKS